MSNSSARKRGAPRKTRMARQCPNCYRLKADVKYRNRDGNMESWCDWCRSQYARSRRHLYGKTPAKPPEGYVTENQWIDLCAHYAPDDVCLDCGEVAKLTIDHVIPCSKGGTAFVDNLQPLCRRCNSKKSDKETDYRPDDGEFARSLRKRGW